jgi:hypothetical protein
MSRSTYFTFAGEVLVAIRTCYAIPFGSRKIECRTTRNRDIDEAACDRCWHSNISNGSTGTIFKFSLIIKRNNNDDNDYNGTIVITRQSR